MTIVDRVLTGCRRVQSVWSGPDHYEWLSEYLATRGRQRATARVIAVGVLFLAGIEVLMMFSPAGPTGAVQRGCALTVVAVCVAISLIWIRPRWPTRTASTVFVLVSAACIGVACVVEADPMSAIAACGLYGVLGGYIGIFHSVRLLAVNLAVAFGVSAVVAFRIAEQIDAVTAVAKLLAVLGGITVIPILCQLLLERLGPDAINSDTDALTGLLNRRALHSRAADVLDGSTGSDGAVLAVYLVDLDDFKRVNDTYGHAVGDAVLSTVARAIQAKCDDSALVARFGGEEFVIAEVVASNDAAMVGARRLSAAVSQTPYGITASVGAATVALARGGVGTPAARRLGDLIAVADRAMYEAKRSGGNGCRHHALDGTRFPQR